MIKPILDKSNPKLRTIASMVNIPSEDLLCKQIIRDLCDTIDDIILKHPFKKGIGLNAVQLGFAKHIFVIKMPKMANKIFINAKLLEVSSETDKQYEGCLSFFQFRGKVERSLKIFLEYYNENYKNQKKWFSFGEARLIQHELDHLNGILYVDRMHKNDELITYDDYKKMGDISKTDWKYEN